MNITINFAVLSGITLGITELIKKIGIDTKWAPLISIITGVGLAWLAGYKMPNFIFAGLVMGLTASGLYSGTKKTIGK